MNSIVDHLNHQSVPRGILFLNLSDALKKCPAVMRLGFTFTSRRISSRWVGRVFASRRLWFRYRDRRWTTNFKSFWVFVILFCRSSEGRIHIGNVGEGREPDFCRRLVAAHHGAASGGGVQPLWEGYWGPSIIVISYLFIYFNFRQLSSFFLPGNRRICRKTWFSWLRRELEDPGKGFWEKKKFLSPFWRSKFDESISLVYWILS